MFLRISSMTFLPAVICQKGQGGWGRQEAYELEFLSEFFHVAELKTHSLILNSVIEILVDISIKQLAITYMRYFNQLC